MRIVYLAYISVYNSIEKTIWDSVDYSIRNSVRVSGRNLLYPAWRILSRRQIESSIKASVDKLNNEIK